MPDSNKNKLRTLKPLLDELLKNKSLGREQKRDSFIKLTNLMKKENLFDSSFYKSAENLTPILKSFGSEFPEYKKFSKKEKSKVFKKAFAILMNKTKS